MQKHWSLDQTPWYAGSVTLRTPLPRCDSETVDASELKNLRGWAAARDQPVTVLDLEATTFIPTAKWFGITEVALLHVNPDGTATTHAALVDCRRLVAIRRSGDSSIERGADLRRSAR